MVHSRWCKTIPSYVLCQLYLREENDRMGRQWHERSIHCVVCRCWLCGMCTIFEVHIRFSYAYSGETYSVSVSWWEQTPGVCEPFYTWSWDRSRWCNPSNNGSSCTQYLGNAYRIFSQAVVSWWQPREIGVVRSGRNPTMRHLERTHGISITSLHEHFSKDHFVLMYEITAKMAADIHTKGFTNPLAWKKACMLINLLEPEDLGSKQLADLVQPTTDVDTTVRQVFQSRTDEVPNFPYTETPILPPEVYRVP